MLSFDKLENDRRSLERSFQQASASSIYPPLFSKFLGLTTQIFGIETDPLFLHDPKTASHCTSLLSASSGLLFRSAELLTHHSDLRCAVSPTYFPSSISSVLFSPSSFLTSTCASSKVARLLHSRLVIDAEKPPQLLVTPLEYLALLLPLISLKSKQFSLPICKSFQSLINSWIFHGKNSESPSFPTFDLFFYQSISVFSDISNIKSTSEAALVYHAMIPIINHFSETSVDFILNSERFMIFQSDFFKLFSNFHSQSENYLVKIWKFYCYPSVAKNNVAVDPPLFWTPINYVVFLIPFINLIKSNSSYFNLESILMACSVFRHYKELISRQSSITSFAPTITTGTGESISPLRRQGLRRFESGHVIMTQNSNFSDEILSTLVTRGCSNLSFDFQRLQFDSELNFKSDSILSCLRTIVTDLQRVTTSSTLEQSRSQSYWTKFLTLLSPATSSTPIFDCSKARECNQIFQSFFNVSPFSVVDISEGTLSEDFYAEYRPSSGALTPRGRAQALTGQAYCSPLVKFRGHPWEKPIKSTEVRIIVEFIVKRLRGVAQYDENLARKLTRLRILADYRVLMVFLFIVLILLLAL
ncbi:hypothetical protein RCL1_001142 [Eukaryota sp. TZLM3-RCL]